MPTEIIRIDIWAGPEHLEHVARTHLRFNSPMLLALLKQELKSGFLIDLRALEPGENDKDNFDLRETISAN